MSRTVDSLTMGSRHHGSHFGAKHYRCPDCALFKQFAGFLTQKSAAHRAYCHLSRSDFSCFFGAGVFYRKKQPMGIKGTL